jgi:phosphoribosylanthranilate isomerase
MEMKRSRVGKIMVQVYEIQDPWEAEAVIGVGVDHIGSVLLTEDDWKVPAIREAVFVARAASVKHSLIPLFSNKEVLFQAIDYYQPNIVHFCECMVDHNPRATSCDALVNLQISVKERTPAVEIMRSIPIATPNSDQRIQTLEIAEQFEEASDYFLTDTWLGSEPVEGYIGITGCACDWQIARKLVEASSIPVILAGGLSPDNVYEAMIAVKPLGADSCTKTNALDNRGRVVRFKKDVEKVKTFVQEVRRAEKDMSDGNTGAP